jgi:trans-aconitate methyltransferase
MTFTKQRLKSYLPRHCTTESSGFRRGTGLYSALVHAVFPNAEFTVLDLAVEMLEKAKSRFSQMVSLQES